MTAHGTYAQAQQHRLRGEPPCDDCRRAASTYQRERRRAMGTSGYHWPLTLSARLVEARGLGVLIAETFRWGA